METMNLEMVEDSCNQEFGESFVDRNGCPDLDGDGISDLNDGFPNDNTRWIKIPIEMGTKIQMTIFHKILHNGTILMEMVLEIIKLKKRR